MIPLKEKYQREVIPAMQARFGYKSPMAVPRVQKVVINTGFGKLVAGKSAEEQKKIEKEILEGLAAITGQNPLLTRAKKSIAGFKLKKGTPIGAKVTLRGKRMYDFLERLIHIVLPRSRDFQGISTKSFGGTGNLTLGIKEHVFFPEISPEKVRTPFGLEVTIVTNAKRQDEGIQLFKLLGFPLK